MLDLNQRPAEPSKPGGALSFAWRAPVSAPDADTLPRLLLDSIAEHAVFAVGLDGRVLSWSAGAAALTGWAAGEAVGRPLDALLPADGLGPDTADEALRAVVEDGRHERDGWLERRDGTRVWANLVLSPLRDGDGRVVGVAAVARDQTVRRTAESLARRAAAEAAARAEAEQHTEDALHLAEQLEAQAVELEHQTDAAQALAAELEVANEALERVVREAESARAAAEESERRFRAAADAAPVLMWTSGVDGACDWFNEPWLAFTGSTLEEALGGAWGAHVHPDDRERCVAVYRTHFAARRPFAMDYRVRRFDGEWRWLLDHGVPRFDEDGDFVGYVGSLVDITERRQLEQQLRVMADAVPQLVWMATPDGRHDFHNGRWYAYTGMPRPGEPGASPDGWRWTEYLHPADRGRALEAWERCLRTGEPYEIEHRLRDAATGCDRWFLGRALPLRDDGGRIVRWFGTCTDIHDQRRAADAQRLLAETSRTLAASLDYEATIASVAAAMVPTLADWCAVDVLESADDGGWPPRVRRVAVAHHDPEQVAWARDLEHTTPTDWSAPSGLARVLRTGEPVFHPTIPEEFILAGATTSEQRALRRRIALHAYICVPLVARGRTLGALTLCLARPGRRYDDDDFALARELAQRSAVAIDNARLLASAATERTAAERARAEAERANLAKSQFLATMSHELRTPLNAIAGYAELLAMGIHGPVCEAQEVALARIQRSQRHLLSLINDILNFAKIEAGHVPLRIGAVPVAQNLAEIEALVAPQLRAKRLVFACGACDPALTARADAEKLRQIVLNLLSNAIKFTPPGGRIELACALAAQAADDGAAVATVGRGAPGARVELRVTDTGCGIPAEKLDAVFDPFVQLDRSFSSAGHEGTGLGLAISRDLARSMGGDLRIERSGPGTGTTFLFTLMAG